jgi:hypothetical protein
MSDTQVLVHTLVRGSRIRGWPDLANDPKDPPRKPGAYAWWFRETPDLVPTAGTVERDSPRLLYVGISPSKPPKAGKQSSQNLRTRIRYHYGASPSCNAFGSTLRFTLGCLLAESLGIRLHVVGSGRMTFGDGEASLTTWMADNALVSWVECAEPWSLEAETIRNIYLPLNLDQNEQSPFYATLSRIRREAKQAARRAWNERR